MRGTVEQRGKNSWRMFAYMGYNPQTGKQNRPTKTIRAENKRQAEKALRMWLIELEKGILPNNNKMTVAQFAEEWLTKHCKADLQPKTIHTYKEKMDGHILPRLGNIKLCDLTPKAIVDFCDTLRQPNQRKDHRNIPDKKLSDQTILHCFRILSSMLQVAVKWQIITSNPASNVKPPKVISEKAPLYDEVVAQQICAALKQEPLQYQLMVILTLHTGMRISEVLGLKWERVDFEANQIYVLDTVQYVPGLGTFIKPCPKNRSSERPLDICSTITDMLKQHRREQEEERAQLSDQWEDHNLAFPKWNGKPFLPNVLSNWFPNFLKRHNLEHLRFHDLRHYNITLLLAMGIPVHDIQARTGHARASTLLDKYGHARKAGNKTIAQEISKVLHHP